jgi:DASS family divalent anion:Na+ symporter
MSAPENLPFFRWSLVLAVGSAIWFSPPPGGLTAQTWHLFAIFFTTILSIIVDILPIFTASILALSWTVLSGTLVAKQAYEGFSQGFILLIVVAFLVSYAVVKSGLGKRIAMLVVRKFGHSTLGLGYSMVATDILIAPAFPSNTARSGVLYPIVQSLALDSGSRPADGTRRKMGAYLMMNSMAGIAISSTMWFTAMASNPLGAKMASELGVEITFGSWFLAALVPGLAAFLLTPLILYRLYPPELKDTPEAPTMAQKVLDEMGPMQRDEWITGMTFLAMVTLWALSGLFPIDKTAVAFGGLGVLMVSNIFTLEDLRGQGEALNTLIWFAVLYTLSSYLNQLGFMKYLGAVIASGLVGMSWPVAYVALVTAYVLIHYLFVSQTAQLLALYGVFLNVGITAGVPPKLLAFMLLFATNFNSIITPQGSSANVLFISSEYMTAGEIYRYGFLLTMLYLFLFLTVGTAWILLIF